jgi:hypothetical protein
MRGRVPIVWFRPLAEAVAQTTAAPHPPTQPPTPPHLPYRARQVARVGVAFRQAMISAMPEVFPPHTLSCAA